MLLNRETFALAAGVQANEPGKSADLIASRVSVGAPMVTFVSDLSGFLSLEGEWRDLYAISASTNPFSTWEWISEWVSFFSPDSLVVAVARQAGQVVAIAPFHRMRYLVGPGLWAECLQLGGPRELRHVNELPQAMIRPGSEISACRSVLKRVAAEFRWDWIELAYHGTQAEAWEAAIATMPSLFVARRTATEIPVMALPASWEALRGTLRRNVKESIRRSYNRLEKAGHALALEIVTEPAEIEDALATVFELHSRRADLTGRVDHHDNFGRGWLRYFLGRAATAMATGGHLEVAHLRIDGEVVASRVFMNSNRSLYLSTSGFDPTWWDYGVMTALLVERLKRATGGGFDEVNFSPGRDQAKSRWNVVNTPAVDVILTRRTIRARAMLRLFGSRKRVSELRRRLIRKARSFRTARPGQEAKGDQGESGDR